MTARARHAALKTSSRPARWGRETAVGLLDDVGQLVRQETAPAGEAVAGAARRARRRAARREGPGLERPRGQAVRASVDADVRQVVAEAWVDTPRVAASSGVSRRRRGPGPRPEEHAPDRSAAVAGWCPGPERADAARLAARSSAPSRPADLVKTPVSASVARLLPLIAIIPVGLARRGPPRLGELPAGGRPDVVLGDLALAGAQIGGRERDRGDPAAGNVDRREPRPVEGRLPAWPQGTPSATWPHATPGPDTGT